MPSPRGLVRGLARLGLDADDRDLRAARRQLRLVGVGRILDAVAGPQAQSDGCGHPGLVLDRLVDAHRLLAEQDVLDAGRGRVLAAQRHGPDPGGLEGVDHRVRQPVVGREDRVHLVVGVHQDLLHQRLGFLVVPTGDELVGDELPVAGVHPLVDGLLVAGLEEERVVVLLAAVEHDDPSGVEGEIVDRRLHGLGHGRADLDVVEAHVGIAARAPGVEPVVLDDGDVGVLGLVDDGGARPGVEAGEHDHARTVGDRLLGLRLLRGGVALGVDDREVVVLAQAGGLERLGEEPPVVLLPSVGRCRVRKQHPDAALAAAVAARRVIAAAVVVIATPCGDEPQDGERGDCPPHSIGLGHGSSPLRMTGVAAEVTTRTVNRARTFGQERERNVKDPPQGCGTKR